MLVIGAVEKYILGAMLAIGVGVMGAFSTGPGGMMQTDEAAFVEAHQGPRIVVVEAWSCGWVAVQSSGAAIQPITRETFQPSAATRIASTS